MQEIPDTGGGLSGFIARGLWYLYQYFPFEGTWDWLLLIVFLAVLLRGLMIPVWWKWMKSTTLSEDERASAMTILLTDLVWPWAAIWLFHSRAGQTFLTGRAGQPGEVAGALYWLCLVCHPTVVVVVWQMNVPPYSFRDAALALVLVHSMVAGAASVLYWYWSTASLAVFLVFEVTAVVTGAVVVLSLRLSNVRSSVPRTRNRTGGPDHGEAGT